MIGVVWARPDSGSFRAPGNASSETSDSETVSSGRLLSIGEVSAILGIPVPTLRSWERRYGFPQPVRTEGGHRRYSDAHLAQLRRIRDGINPGGRRASDVIREVLV